jgi:NAD(P)-dependent dehydrogenase (short-subunit alcohol dehydrogenase family)
VAEQPLAGRGIVVVGGSRGIGAAVAARLATMGAGVVINGRDGRADPARAPGDDAAESGQRPITHRQSEPD